MDAVSAGMVERLLRWLKRPVNRFVRWFRRVRWKRRAGWTARTMHQHPQMLLAALGNHPLRLAQWEVQGPRYSTWTKHLDLLKTSTSTFSLFPSEGFSDDRGGTADDISRLHHGRYWAILHGLNDNGDLVPVCKVPFGIHENTSKLWHAYDTRVLTYWQRRFGGIPTGPLKPPDDPYFSR